MNPLLSMAFLAFLIQANECCIGLSPAPTCLTACQWPLNSDSSPELLDDVPTLGPLTGGGATDQCPTLLGSSAYVSCPAGQQLFADFDLTAGIGFEQCDFGSYPTIRTPSIRIDCSGDGWVINNRSFESIGCSPCPAGWPIPVAPADSMENGGQAAEISIPTCTGSVPNALPGVSTNEDCVNVCTNSTQCFATFFNPTSLQCYTPNVDLLGCYPTLPTLVVPSDAAQCPESGCPTRNTVCHCPNDAAPFQDSKGPVVSKRVSNYWDGGESDQELFCIECSTNDNFDVSGCDNPDPVPMAGCQAIP